VFHDNLPRTDTGKVLRRVLVQELLAADPVKDLVTCTHSTSARSCFG
jgi:acyl-coenzyme A synthetase/AMP-(fatty) acid ligase